VGRASGEHDPIFDLIEAHSQAWAQYFYSDAIEKWERGRGVTPEIEAAHDNLDQALCDAMAKLRGTPPTTLAGAWAIIEYLIEWDRDCVPKNSGEYLPTLLRSPIFSPWEHGAAPNR
jgi:hypothetical protein